MKFKEALNAKEVWKVVHEKKYCQTASKRSNGDLLGGSSYIFVLNKMTFETSLTALKQQCINAIGPLDSLGPSKLIQLALLLAAKVETAASTFKSQYSDATFKGPQKLQFVQDLLQFLVYESKFTEAEKETAKNFIKTTLPFAVEGAIRMAHGEFPELQDAKHVAVAAVGCISKFC